MLIDNNAPHAVRHDPDGHVDHNDHDSEKGTSAKLYWRFAAMVLAGGVVMYAGTRRTLPLLTRSRRARPVRKGVHG